MNPCLQTHFSTQGPGPSKDSVARPKQVSGLDEAHLDSSSFGPH